jgi:hypothetical protein
MAFSDYTLASAKRELGLNLIEDQRLFPVVEPAKISEFLQTALQKFVPLALAINSEKSRSEWIIAPILAEVREQLGHQISLFSGIKLSVEPGRGLEGYCDYLISQSPEQYYLTAPVVTIVEAKKENINDGLGQCIATMVAAQIFNQRNATPVDAIFGAVTTGTNWRFLRLSGQDVILDLDEYSVREIETLVGLLRRMMQPNG